MIWEGEAAIQLETTRRAFLNQEKSKQRSAIVPTTHGGQSPSLINFFSKFFDLRLLYFSKIYEIEASELNLDIGSRRPMPFQDFTLFVVVSFFTTGSPNAGRNFLPVLGEPVVKREKTTNNVKSWNGIGLVRDPLRRHLIFKCYPLSLCGICG